MPRLSTSDSVKIRVAHLLERLLAHANHELDDEPDLGQLAVRWVEQHPVPKLVVQATIKDLANLCSLDFSDSKSTEQLRQDLRVCKEFLHILDDNRTRTQGSSLWHFTLKLWHSSTAKNLIELERHWQQCKSPQANWQMRELEPPETLAAENGESPRRENLPTPSYIQFIGRAAQIEQLLTLLHRDHPAARIEVTGIGGVGKTSLILAVAYCCLAPERDRNGSAPLPKFDSIIFTSAKPQQLAPSGVLPHPQPARSLSQICRSILQTLGDTSWLEKDLADQCSHIQASFRSQQVLLIIDNLETLEEEQSVLAFLYALPPTVKVVVTSCRRAVFDLSVHLEALPEAEGICFIQAQAQTKAVDLSPAEAHQLHQATGGIPAAIVYAMGQLAQGYLLPDALPRLTLPAGEYCRFYLEGSVKALVGQSAHYLLMGLALFAVPPTKETIIQVILPDATEGLVQLHQLSLATRQAERYTMLPLTRNYALAELQQQPEFERSVRAAWVSWSLRFCQQHGNQSWKEWFNYTALDVEWDNIQAVIEWCIEQDRYEDFSQIWQYVRGYTNLYGYQSERLIWMDWWMQAAQQRSDQAMLAQALRDRAWTLTLMGKPDYLAEAERLLTKAWDLASPQFQLELALERAMLSIHQARFELAQRWLQQAEMLLPQLPQIQHDASQRHSIRIDYYRAEVCCRQGESEQAKLLFRQVLADASAAGWQQVEIYTLNWLAEIALDQTDLEQAESLLSQSLPIVQQQGDKRSIAFHARSKAHLEHLQGDEIAAEDWLKVATEYFTDLGMDSEVQEARRRLELSSR